MICISISEKDPAKISKLIKLAEIAEIRLDLTGFDEQTIRSVFTPEHKMIATFRPGDHSDEYRMQMLMAAIDAGAAYVDIEYESTHGYTSELMHYAHENGCSVILSYHNYRETPTRSILEQIIHNMYQRGGDVAKIATQVNHTFDISTILGLYGTDRRLVALGMGEKGRITRVMSLFLGAEFSFAAVNKDQLTAPGQMTIEEMKKKLELLKTL